ncbi:MAG TPA: type II secretion system protein [Planctomycetota bacterium]|nr:type II secretion system protein [Planctomycetota bacterium]
MYRARGFTLIELLVVISLIIALLAVGAVSLSGMLSRSVLKQAQQEVAGAFMYARQIAISRQTRCIAEIVVINDQSYRTSAPGTPYTLQQDGSVDCVRVRTLKRVRDVDTGVLRYVLDAEVLREVTLGAAVVFDDERGSRRWYPANENVLTDLDSNGVVDATPSVRVFLCFEPDGTCTASGPALPDATPTYIRLKDVGSGETGGVYVYPTTGVVKIK